MYLVDDSHHHTPQTPPTLLQALQEHPDPSSAHPYPLPETFFVLATQNPIEQEGTYPLPEAQLDRFMFNVTVSYPGRSEELDIMKQTTSSHRPAVEPILTSEQILQLQEVVRQVVVADHVFEYA